MRKHRIIIFVSILAFFIHSVGCHVIYKTESSKSPALTPGSPVGRPSLNLQDTTDSQEAPVEVDISINMEGIIYSAKLYDNSSTQALLELMPFTAGMHELNGNEKYYDLPNPLPVDSHPISEISRGDIMLYGDDCLVLFYKTFKTSYSYTRLGYVLNAADLAETLGSGDVQLTFSQS